MTAPRELDLWERWHGGANTAPRWTWPLLKAALANNRGGTL